MDRWILTWLIGLYIMGFLVLVYEYLYPSGEGYTVSRYSSAFRLNPITDKYAFKISAWLYIKWKRHNGGSFIEYHRGK